MQNRYFKKAETIVAIALILGMVWAGKKIETNAKKIKSAFISQHDDPLKAYMPWCEN
ncbi:hypothetical protein [Persicobacter diffluens]|uniref:Uncharacterized protein n=1 Tax=Persicobacter diffluens TaxID=981 RepID=A0AAN4W150_9BACT|nr:hypothetical protein PEDI_43080 [Persicobacter diffluens]